MNVKVYSKPNCPWCVKAKELLNERSIPYQELMFEQDFNAQELQEKIGNRKLTVPQILFDDKLIGGYDSLRVYLRAE